MVLQAEITIVQSKNAHTQYLAIPSVMVQDSHYPFKDGEKVRIIIDPYRKLMIIRSLEKPEIRVSVEGIYMSDTKITVRSSNSQNPKSRRKGKLV
jgi:hypothetical protein